MFKSRHVPFFFFPSQRLSLQLFWCTALFLLFINYPDLSLFFHTESISCHRSNKKIAVVTMHSPEWTVGTVRFREREVSKKPQRAALTIHSNKNTQESSIKTKWHLRSTEYVKHCPAEPHQTRSTKWTTLIWVAFLTSGWSQCFPDYFWVSGNVAGASALWVTPHRSQRMSVATNTPLSTSHLKRQCSYSGQVCPIVQCNVILWWSNATHSSWYVPWR